MIGTKTIHEGDSREAGLQPILQSGGAISMARRSLPWPGDATVRVDLLSIVRGAVVHAVLNGAPVERISSRLDVEPEGQPLPLAQNRQRAFEGSIVLGLGFVLDPAEAEALIGRNSRNKDCLFPYLNGKDLNSQPDQSPSRWVIQFDERSEDEARSYHDLWRVVEERVRPDRATRDGAKYPRMVDEWWKHWNNRRALYRAVRALPRVLARGQVSATHAMCFVASSWIYDAKVMVFAFDSHYEFAILQSHAHEEWARRYSSTLRGDLSYAPTDCFENFPFPQDPSDAGRRAAEHLGHSYDEHRTETMRARGLGLTKTYNLVNDERRIDADIQRLRQLHAEMDRAVLACYKWSDLDLGHAFYRNERDQLRFTISPEARRELLRRLLALNVEVARQEREAAVEPSRGRR